MITDKVHPIHDQAISRISIYEEVCRDAHFIYCPILSLASYNIRADVGLLRGEGILQDYVQCTCTTY